MYCCVVSNAAGLVTSDLAESVAEPIKSGMIAGATPADEGIDGGGVAYHTV